VCMCVLFTSTYPPGQADISIFRQMEKFCALLEWGFTKVAVL